MPQVRTVRRRQCGPRTVAWQRHCIRTIQRSRGANEAVRLFEMPVGASGQREHKRLAAAHVGVARADRELGRGGRCRRAQQRQHRTQCPTHGDVARHTENRSLRARRYKTRYRGVRYSWCCEGVPPGHFVGYGCTKVTSYLMTPVVTLQRSLPREPRPPRWLRCVSCGTTRCCTT